MTAPLSSFETVATVLFFTAASREITSSKGTEDKNLKTLIRPYSLGRKIATIVRNMPLCSFNYKRK